MEAKLCLRELHSDFWHGKHYFFPDFLAISKIIELLPNQPRYYEGLCAGTCYQPVIPDGMACYITRIIMSLGGIGVFRSSRTCMECTCSHLHDIFLLVNGYKSILVVIRPPPQKKKKKVGWGEGQAWKNHQIVYHHPPVEYGKVRESWFGSFARVCDHLFIHRFIQLARFWSRVCKGQSWFGSLAALRPFVHS